MKLSDLLGAGGVTINAKNINIINTAPEDDKEVVNPGIEYGKDQKAKWSPPLQQELSVMKSAVGETPSPDTTVKDPNAEAQVAQAKGEKMDNQIEFMKRLVAILSQ